MQVWHLFWRISASNCFCTALAPINVISLLYIQHSVANKEIKLGQTFLSAVSTNFFFFGGGQKFYRLCIGLGWLKIGLNNNILLLFFPNTCLCNRKKIIRVWITARKQMRFIFINVFFFNCCWKKRPKTFPCLHKSKREAIWQ